MKTFIEHNLPTLERIDTDAESGRMYLTPTGKKYPSVTSVMSLHSRQAIMEWRSKVGAEEANRVSKRASRRGTSLHLLCEKYLLGEPVQPSMFDIEMFNSIKPFLNRIDNIHCLETPLFSHHLEVAGTVDCIAEFDGKLSIIDFKTSAKEKRKEWISGYFMQTAAYAVMFEEMTGIPINRTVIIMGVDAGEPQLFIEKRDTWIGQFIETRVQYRKTYGF